MPESSPLSLPARCDSAPLLICASCHVALSGLHVRLHHKVYSREQSACGFTRTLLIALGLIVPFQIHPACKG